VTISPTEALTRCIEHREIFHDEMLHLMRMLMRGEMSPQIASALLMGLRVKKETIGEITAAAQVMREFATPVVTPNPQDLLDMCGTGGGGRRADRQARQPQRLVLQRQRRRAGSPGRQPGPDAR
jgi:anthranilate phosphoribosyltransferase